MLKLLSWLIKAPPRGAENWSIGTRENVGAEDGASGEFWTNPRLKVTALGVLVAEDGCLVATVVLAFFRAGGCGTDCERLRFTPALVVVGVDLTLPEEEAAEDWADFLAVWGEVGVVFVAILAGRDASDRRVALVVIDICDEGSEIRALFLPFPSSLLLLSFPSSVSMSDVSSPLRE